jgi:hypothetical protein
MADVRDREFAASACNTTLACASFQPVVFRTLWNGPMIAALSVLPNWSRPGRFDHPLQQQTAKLHRTGASPSLSCRAKTLAAAVTFQTDPGGAGFNALFLYDFDSPDTTGQPGGSLGNNLESIIGPGDSGGPALVADGSGYDIAGVNTFVEGYGGHFGDIGGGIVLAPYLDWINTTMAVPEPSVSSLAILGLAILLRGCVRHALFSQSNNFRFENENDGA